jgi:hypothetical protein
MVTTYNAGLYLNGDLPEPYERATIEVKTCADSRADAIQNLQTGQVLNLATLQSRRPPVLTTRRGLPLCACLRHERSGLFRRCHQSIQISRIKWETIINYSCNNVATE